MKHTIKLLILISVLLTLTACSSKSDFMKQDALQAAGNYPQAVKHARSFVDFNDSSARDNLLWELYLGQSQYFDNNITATIGTFDEAERLMKYHRERILAIDLAKDLGALLSNDNTQPYIGNEYDGIMLNTYKALAYLKKNDFSGSRVEFNRLIDRQRRAKEFFAESMDKEREAQEKEHENNNAIEQPSENEENSHMQGVINQSYPELNTYSVYPDFINPLSNYLAALFALANDDTSKAEFLLKETAAMLPDNKTIQEDYANLDTIKDEATVWVIYEDGLAPTLDEMRIDFPAWIFTSQVNVVSIALPRMHERTAAFEYLEIRDGNKSISKTELLSSMEGVMKTEFKMKYPGIIKRAALSAVSKAVLQNAANNTNNNWISLATTLYTILSTQADTRIWSALPKNFHVARFKKEDLKSVDLYIPQGFKIKTIKLLNAKHSLIYVKIPTLAHKAHVSILPLGDSQ